MEEPPQPPWGGSTPPTEPPPPPPPRRRPLSPAQAWRRLRSRLPVSPLPWRWHRRLPKLVLAAILILAVGGAVASILLQGDDDTSGARELPANLAPQVKQTLAKMSAAEKVDAVLLLGFSDGGRVEALLRKAELGGVFIGAEAWPGAGSGRRLTERLRAAGSGRRRVPPLIATRQEGGEYRSLDDLPPSETELAIGETGDPQEAETWALETGRSLRSEGFDLNLAPVADVATLDTPIADRAFGDDPELVAQMTVAALRGCDRGGIACAVSHFPGLGGAAADPALGPATVGLDEEALESRDLVPFEAAFRARVPAVVVSLAFYAAFDPVTPGALSVGVADDLLREQLGFRGVAITDDLSSGAIRAGQGAADAAPAALAAGADLLLISDPAEAIKARASLQEAVRSGAIPEDRLDQAVARVLSLKRRLGLLRAP